MEKLDKKQLEKMSREEKIKYVTDSVKLMKDMIGNGTEDDDLSNVYLENFLDESQTCAGQNYEDLAIVYHCLERFLDQVTYG